jgi:hypothetical protein
MDSPILKESIFSIQLDIKDLRFYFCFFYLRLLREKIFQYPLPISNTNQIIRPDLLQYTYCFLPGPALSALPPFWPPRGGRDPPFFD